MIDRTGHRTYIVGTYTIYIGIRDRPDRDMIGTTIVIWYNTNNSTVDTSILLRIYVEGSTYADRLRILLLLLTFLNAPEWLHF